VNPTPSERKINIEEPVIFKDSLPKISLPDFVITGQERINVESSKKVEFEDSRVFSLADERINFINKDVYTRTTDIPLKKLNAMDDISIFNGFLKAQVGNFKSADISGGVGYNYDRYFGALYGSYLSRKEHNMKNSDFSTSNIGVILGGTLPVTNNIFSEVGIRLNIGHEAGWYNNYGRLLYDGFVSGGMIHIYFAEPPSFHKFLPRHYNSFFINSSITSNKEEYFKYRLNIQFDKYNNKFDTNPALMAKATIGHNIEETKIALAVGGDYRYEEIDFSGDILFYNNSYSTIVPYGWTTTDGEKIRYDGYDISKNSTIFGLFGNGSVEISNNIFAMAGFKFYAYNYLDLFIKDKSIPKGTILPQLLLKYENRNNFSLSLCYSPDLEILSFQKLYKLNRFALYRDIILSPYEMGPFRTYQGINHVITPVNIFVHFDISAIKNLRILANIGYLEEKNTPYFYSQDAYFEFNESIPISYRDYYPYFHEASTKGIYCNLKMDYNINEFNIVSFAFNYQNKKIDSLRVPFVPQIEASINYYLLLDHNKVQINPSIEFLGDRISPVLHIWEMYDYSRWEYNIFREEKENPVVLVNLNVEYSIIKNLIANLTITNMLNSKYSYYRGYQEYPFSIFVGLKFKW
jgi:hypothetical protein